jgi:hypothetical protein
MSKPKIGLGFKAYTANFSCCCILAGSFMQQLGALRIIMGEQKMDNLKVGLFVAVDCFSYILSPVKKSIVGIMSSAL